MKTFIIRATLQFLNKGNRKVEFHVRVELTTETLSPDFKKYLLDNYPTVQQVKNLKVEVLKTNS